MTHLGWWTISGEALLEALHAVAEGEEPEVVYMTLSMQGDHECPEESTLPLM